MKFSFESPKLTTFIPKKEFDEFTADSLKICCKQIYQTSLNPFQERFSRSISHMQDLSFTRKYQRN